MAVVLLQGLECVWDKDTEFPQYQPLIIDSSQDFVLPVLEGGNRIVRSVRRCKAMLVVLVRYC